MIEETPATHREDAESATEQPLSGPSPEKAHQAPPAVVNPVHCISEGERREQTAAANGAICETASRSEGGESVVIKCDADSDNADDKVIPQRTVMLSAGGKSQPVDLTQVALILNQTNRSGGPAHTQTPNYSVKILATVKIIPYKTSQWYHLLKSVLYVNFFLSQSYRNGGKKSSLSLQE